MNPFFVLIKREWWEWKNTVLWVCGIYIFLLLLSLVPITRLSHNIDPENVNIEFNNREMNREDQDSRQYERRYEGWQFADPPLKALAVYSLGLVGGIQFLQILLLFIGLFYFADSLYNERMDFCTLFIRSQPISDHAVIISKIVSGFLGIIGLALVLSLLFLLFIKTALGILGANFGDMITSVTSRVKVTDLYADMVVFQFVSLLWLSPFIMFLMWVSASVRKRPLIIGLGAPALAAISLYIVFGNAELIRQLFMISGNIKDMLLEQFIPRPGWHEIPDKVEIFGSFGGYLATPRTVMSLAVASGFYALTWFSYRKNIPVS